jgi:hypothetical protein
LLKQFLIFNIKYIANIDEELNKNRKAQIDSAIIKILKVDKKSVKDYL